MKEHEPAARSTAKRSLRPLGPPRRAGTSSPAATTPGQSETEFQRVVHELQVHQEELEAQNEELRETQQLLEASRDRYADLYDFAPIGYATLDEKGHIREINLTGATILGRERSRLLGTLFSVAVAKDDLSAFHGHLRQCQQGRGPVTTELTLTVHDRPPVPVQLHSVPILDLTGQTTMYRTAITDITERKRAEKILRLAHDQLEDRVRERTAELAGAVAELRKEISERERVERALRESEEAQRTLFESAPDPIVVVDAEGRIARVNRQAEVMFGYQRSELIGQLVEMMVPERFRDSHVRHRAGDIGSPHLRPMGAGLQLFGRRKDGSEFPADIMLSPLTGKHGTMVIAVVRDVTERKRGEEALRQLSVRLLRTQDEERRRIARELHDSTGQKLAALAMNLSLIGKSAETLDARARKALTESLALLDRSSRDIRTLSYLLHPPLLDERGLAAAVRWFADGFTQRSGVQVTLEVPPDLQRLPEEIEMALFRIVQEGLTNIHRHSESSTAMIRLMVDQQQVQMEMRDAGKGLPKPRSDGYVAPLGVGITGMRERVIQLGGQMKMESGSRGTTVSVTLPLTKAAS
jgi:PAS domain S-box-containing protein